ncbi:hypothetical protein SERLA73DRAFT_185790 [Serpula lacrymans var. lacrymans S7.3]|uniref:Uncharacterized protein n=2 Tax=Serpula lacrymans var. lacrymans TaxID=341189 RepID=F8Q6D9_SERL3|nr:uncharacterized protein SERLADRAFT_474510 [Serpula lacrymans var. lacrymans S7.9]EGN96177.1 hypothetical protein SERLA73DRAFT_185790 [Serpula lacrymans var. lacrymans S7.3]EGO21721.1 hypothetical protein SERLADRAFT_474510 [Serpula lacrymans var. lacrymans S7.9]
MLLSPAFTSTFAFVGGALTTLHVILQEVCGRHLWLNNPFRSSSSEDQRMETPEIEQEWNGSVAHRWFKYRDQSPSDGVLAFSLNPSTGTHRGHKVRRPNCDNDEQRNLSQPLQRF